MRLTNKAIVVTGSTGIAASAAQMASDEGARVHVIARDEASTSELAEAVGGSSSVADLRHEDETTAAFATARASLGRIDGLLAVAGGSGRSHGDGPIHEIPKAGWDATIDQNLTPVFLASRETVVAMRDQGGGGSIVLVSSVLASAPSPQHFSTHAYAAAKGAQQALAKSMASRYATERIRVNTIAPSLVDTPMSARAKEDPEIVSFASSKQPLVGDLLMPEDVAHAAVFLLSDESRAITGQVLSVDGGWKVTETIK